MITSLKYLFEMIFKNTMAFDKYNTPYKRTFYHT